MANKHETKSKFPVLILIIAIGLFAFLIFSAIEFNTKTHQAKRNVFWIFEKEKAYFTLDQVNQLVAEIIPLIEKKAGKKFKKIPEIRLTDTKGLENIISREGDLNLLNGWIGLDQKSIAYLAGGLVGLYGTVDQILYLLPKRIGPICKMLEIDEKKYGMDIVRIVLTHELTHALQDQYISLWDKRNSVPGKEELDALSATLEGHAEMISKKVAHQMGIEKAIIDRFPLSKPGNFKQKQNHLKQCETGFHRHDIYTLGEKFIEFHDSKNGSEWVWCILSDPPVNTVMVANPEMYSQGSYDFIDYKSMLEDLYEFDGQFKNVHFVFHNNSYSRFDLESMYEPINFPNKDVVISNVRHYQSLSIYYQDVLKAQITLVLLENQKDSSQNVALREKYVSYYFNKIKQYFVKSLWKELPLNQNCLGYNGIAKLRLNRLR